MYIIFKKNCINLEKRKFILLLFIMEMIWFFLLFSGSISYDSYNQISQTLGLIPLPTIIQFFSL